MKISKTLCLTAMALVAVGAHAENARLLTPAAGDLVSTELVAGVQKAMAPDVSHEAVTFTYALDPANEIRSEAAPSVTRSKEYFVEVGGDELRRGAAIYTTAPGALVRINPAVSEQMKGRAAALAIDPSQLVVRTAAGDEMAADRAMSRLVDAEQMKATGVPFAAGTTAFRLAPEVGVGTITIAAPGLKSNAVYAVHVFDKESDVVLAMGSRSADYFHGQAMAVDARFEDAAGSFDADTMEGFVTAPGGQAWPVSFVTRDGEFHAELPLDAAAGAGPGLWELHMVARGERDGLTVMRNASTAFAAHVPTAALDGTVRLHKTAGLSVELGVEVAAAGRYEIRGVVYGTNAAGALVPFAAAHSADWLDTSGSLRLTVEPGLMRDAGVGSPFEVRDLRLLDQGRMGVLHRQARGLTIER